MVYYNTMKYFVFVYVVLHVMSSSSTTTTAKGPNCAVCEKKSGIFTCGGCSRAFCTEHANKHRQLLGKEMDEIVIQHDQLLQSIHEQTNDISQCSTMREIEQWEQRSIDKIKQIGNITREKLSQYLAEQRQRTQATVQELTEKLSTARREDDFVETDLKRWSDRIYELKTDISASIPIFFENIGADLIQLAPYSSSRLIELQRIDATFGFQIMTDEPQNFVSYISKITPNSAAWKHGGLHVDDQLLSVNGISVENECHKKIFDLIRQTQESVKLVVRSLPKNFYRMKE